MKLSIIKWRDIPTQVMIKKSRKQVEKALLDNRFMEAVDMAAMVGGAADSDAYLNDWQTEVIDVGEGDMATLVAEQVTLLETAFPPELLQQYVQNKGYKPD